jgi:hypothetical protein
MKSKMPTAQKSNMTDEVTTYEQFIAEGVNIAHSMHDDEFERHLGMTKQHMYHAPHKKELVHMYVGKPEKKKPIKKGQPAPKTLESKAKVLKSMMKYHGYEPIKNSSKTRLSWSKDAKDKYHEIHADIDADGHPKTVYHKERFKK